MKKLLLVLFVLAHTCVAEFNFDNTNADEIAACSKYFDRLRLRNLELKALAKECTVDNKDSSCHDIETTSKKMKIDTIVHSTMRPFALVTFIGFYYYAHFNRQEAYGNDENVLVRYKELLPHDLYSLLSDFEEEMTDLNNECVGQKNANACKGSFDKSETHIKVIKTMGSLKHKDPYLYMLMIDYFTEAMLSQMINTKSKFIDKREKLIDLVTSFSKNSEEEEKKYEEYINTVKEMPEEIWDDEQLELQEIRQKLNAI